jgi:hypothetical protein
MKAIQIKVNKNGVKYGLFSDLNFLSVDDCIYAVYVVCENYNRHAKGGIAKTWRYVERNLSLEAAQKLFDRRSK